uniref:Uncharacterized protein n=1 Tax=Lepeophtheirus salmonis TaxID=72036 RepID=A0A0K2UIG0_LEPSM
MLTHHNCCSFIVADWSFNSIFVGRVPLSSERSLF